MRNDIIKRIIKKYGNELGEINSNEYIRIREGVYTTKSDSMTLTRFASGLDIANIVLEVPSFTFDTRGHPVQVDQNRITDTNVEILSRIAEYANQFVKT